MSPPGNIVCDLDGVVYLGHVGIPGAGEALATLAGRGYRLVFATNAPIRTAAEVAVAIERATGYPAAPQQVVTAAMAAAELLGRSDTPVLVVGESGLGATLAQFGLTLTADPGRARSVVVGLDRNLTYEHLRAATQAVLAGARLVACNRDPTYPTPTGLWPGGGAIVAAIETAAGRVAELAGKPSPAMSRAVRRLLGPGPTWVVGDRPETDLALGHEEGWGTVLVLSGVVSTAAAVPPHLQPDLVLPALADLPAHLP